ncbi:hypothetical protein NDU88_010004 [Pleurodeles waltl]|uniref:Uncharacterized protein n=1 Tax=Pleurodeles waltl TaxID=8319 RepID=A0AAV7PUR2_PLEWA|nr:hypothetical protein NDU88_010004 [Pleurodeles waltl]
MKRRVKEDFWRPGVDREIERYVRECCMCDLSDKSQVTYPSPVDSIEVKNVPWSKLAFDIYGPFGVIGGAPKYALVMVDNMTKWPEVKFVDHMNTDIVKTFFKEVFLREGFPEEIMGHNWSPTRWQVGRTSSTWFNIRQGTRQGYSQFPILFALAMCGMGIGGRSVSGISVVRGVSDKISLYADDVLLFLDTPEESGPRAL